MKHRLRWNLSIYLESAVNRHSYLESPMTGRSALYFFSSRPTMMIVCFLLTEWYLRVTCVMIRLILICTWVILYSCYLTLMKGSDTNYRHRHFCMTGLTVLPNLTTRIKTQINYLTRINKRSLWISSCNFCMTGSYIRQELKHNLTRIWQISWICSQKFLW